MKRTSIYRVTDRSNRKGRLNMNLAILKNCRYVSAMVLVCASGPFAASPSPAGANGRIWRFDFGAGDRMNDSWINYHAMGVGSRWNLSARVWRGCGRRWRDRHRRRAARIRVSTAWLTAPCPLSNECWKRRKPGRRCPVPGPDEDSQIDDDLQFRSGLIKKTESGYHNLNRVSAKDMMCRFKESHLSERGNQ